MSFCDLKNVRTFNPLNIEMFIPQKVLQRKLINEYYTNYISIEIMYFTQSLTCTYNTEFFDHENIFLVFELVIMVVLKCFFFPL